MTRIKQCKTCEKLKPLTEFFSNGYTPKGTKKTKPSCKECDTKHKRALMQNLYESIVEMKCAVCGYDKCFSAIDFHHLDPTKKDFGIRDTQLRDVEKLRKEISKCAVLCVRCHKEYHAGVLEVNETHRAILK